MLTSIRLVKICWCHTSVNNYHLVTWKFNWTRKKLQFCSSFANGWEWLAYYWVWCKKKPIKFHQRRKLRSNGRKKCHKNVVEKEIPSIHLIWKKKHSAKVNSLLFISKLKWAFTWGIATIQNLISIKINLWSKKIVWNEDIRRINIQPTIKVCLFVIGQCSSERIFTEIRNVSMIWKFLCSIFTSKQWSYLRVHVYIVVLHVHYWNVCEMCDYVCTHTHTHFNYGPINIVWIAVSAVNKDH